MVRLINQHDLNAAQSLSTDELNRLRARISDLVNQAVREHGCNGGQASQQQGDAALMDLYGSLHSDIPKASDEDVSASIAVHIARENPRPTG